MGLYWEFFKDLIIKLLEAAFELNILILKKWTFLEIPPEFFGVL